MKIDYYNGMVLFISGVSGKGQLRLKDLLGCTWKIVWSVSKTENLLIYVTLMSNYIQNTVQQPIKKLNGLQKHKTATDQIRASVWAVRGAPCSASPSRCPLLFCEICIPAPFSRYSSLRQLSVCFCFAERVRLAFSRGRDILGKY